MNQNIISILFICFVLDFLYGWDFTSDQTLNINNTLENYRPLFPHDSTNTLSNGAVYTINFTATGLTPGAVFSVFILGNDKNPVRFEGGSLNFYYDGTRIGTNTNLGGLFITREKAGTNTQPLIFDSNISVRMAAGSNMGRAVFWGPSSGVVSGILHFNKNTFIDANNALPRLACGTASCTSGTYVRSIIELENAGVAYFNYDPTTNQSVDVNNIVQLKGDINFSDTAATASRNSSVFINLTNPYSFLIGKTRTARDDPTSNSFVNLTLENGGKWFLTDDSYAGNLSVSNSSLNPDIPISLESMQNLSIVDLAKYASSNIPGVYCPNDDCPRTAETFAPRTLKTQSINGENGIFALMADLASGQSDRIEAGEVRGVHFIQIYQNPNNILLTPATPNMVVAEANTLGDGADFRGIATLLGLYDYLPILQKNTTATGGSEWVLSAIERTPSQTAKSLLNIFSLPYMIYRLQADNLHTRVDDLTYPPTLNGAWVKTSGGGIYAKQPDGAPTTQNLFYHFSGGYDVGETFETWRYFYGGNLGYTHLNASDSGYQGKAEAIELGAYGGYIQQEGWVLDGSMGYIYAPVRTHLNAQDTPIDFNSHMLLMSARAGYKIYPFSVHRTRTIEKCIQKVFCRNVKVATKIKDTRTYLEPYASLSPGVVWGQEFSFVQKQSQVPITAKLGTAPVLISKIGLLGVKRYEYDWGVLSVNALVEYSADLNLGGKVTLIDTAKVPLYNDANHADHRLGMGAGIKWLGLYDSLSLFADFKTEFFGRLNTYWLISAGLRYKFGQKPPKAMPQLSTRPIPKRPKDKNSQKSKKMNFLKPYEPPLQKAPDTFYRENHFEGFPK
ncbi:autotransporter outer membrane beta-barrel domain-containing protein [Helicobacter sp. 11S02596-1]|uniref:autotransporter outer membrane beta-barrel domain-containing protein n=1 Tax=Helicobacter sp. 11S02596-1 TaxID=1476194 RepID=UPI000BA59890|nr:autotransporter outer membrane beta-barrel domain-containing protein [Helicobacter sp. 11S02596-1]